jgi:hypothetical protein
MVKLSIKERRDYFLFFLGLAMFTTALLSFGMFHNYGNERVVSKEDLAEKLLQDEIFEADVREQRPTIDTSYKQISRFDPGVQAVFLENDINNTLNSIQSIYQRKAYDSRYKTFNQISQLYHDLFYNRRELKGNNSDIEKMSKSLEDCNLSTRQLKETLGNQSNK